MLISNILHDKTKVTLDLLSGADMIMELMFQIFNNVLF